MKGFQGQVKNQLPGLLAGELDFAGDDAGLDAVGGGNFDSDGAEAWILSRGAVANQHVRPRHLLVKGRLCIDVLDQQGGRGFQLNASVKAAKAMDVLGNKEARVWVSMVKAMVPERACKVIDQAIQMHGATGISQWTPLAEMYQDVRHLRFADGPDEVHWMVVGRHEISMS